MAHARLFAALTLILAGSPVAAQDRDEVPMAAPAGGPDTRYCLRVEPNTGSRIETIECFTRQDWADLGVNIDREWPREGVGIIHPGDRQLS